MALQYISTGDGTAAIGSDSATNERGFLIKIRNKTGETSVKGKVVVTALGITLGVALLGQNASDWRPPVGVIAEGGKPDGSDMWVWTSGSVCKILAKNSIAVTEGAQLCQSDVEGRVVCLTDQNNTITEYSLVVASSTEVAANTNETLVLGLLK